MDPCLVDAKSDVSRGYWALATLLHHVTVPGAEDGRTGVVPLQDTQETAVAPRTPTSWRGAQRAYEPHDVYAAIERQDIETIMAVRDADFALLLGDDGRTPLEYAISLGDAYARTSLFLAGALSRFVNQLPDRPEEASAQTLETLRKVRANLKLAIDHSLDREQTAMLASYLQILVMAEGVRWIAHAVKAVAHEFRASAAGDAYAAKPTAVARDMLQRLLTTNLRTRRQNEEYMVAAIEDYLANATADLVLMALWDRVRGADPPLPEYAFARDDRIATAFAEAVEAARHAPATRSPPRLWALAQRTADALDAGLRRRTAKERFIVIARCVD